MTKALSIVFCTLLLNGCGLLLLDEVRDEANKQKADHIMASVEWGSCKDSAMVVAPHELQPKIIVDEQESPNGRKTKTTTHKAPPSLTCSSVWHDISQTMQGDNIILACTCNKDKLTDAELKEARTKARERVRALKRS